MVIFEVIHEKGWPLTKFSLCRNIPLGYESYPPEQIIYNNKFKKMSVISERSLDTNLRDYDPTILAGLYNKLRHGFYDNYLQPDQSIVIPKYRTALDIATAIYELLNKLKCTPKIQLKQVIQSIQDIGYTEEYTSRPEINFPDRKKNINYKSKVHPYWKVEENAPLTLSVKKVVNIKSNKTKKNK